VDVTRPRTTRSSLPLLQYRGAAPIPRAILGGETVTGVSIIELHPAAFDAGRVLDQVRVPLAPDEGCARCVAGGVVWLGGWVCLLLT
jgi:folate-dependent phosphoribosylglycinamide formyltransferase PurN